MTNELSTDHVQGFPYHSKLRGPSAAGIDYAAELEKRMPIMQEKLENPRKSGTRESRLGLRNMFAKSRLSRDAQTLTDSIFASNLTASRVSLVSMEQSSQPSEQETSLPTDFSWTPLPVMPEDSDSEQAPSPQRPKTASTKGRRAPSGFGWQASRDSPPTWSPPHLFKAFPQAVRHVTLPATLLTADAILRMSGRRNSLQGKEGQDATLNAAELGLDGIEGDEDKSKKKTRRNRAASAAGRKWTRKLYVLVTSGYLLQYPAEGSYDRLPEKVLRLGSLSAAFASDAIPGRHWVIQVSSVADMDDAPAAESRSIFSKLSFRTAERRTATNLLMVFEDAESMESWITTLRTEIERLGGKKKLSETGRPKNETAGQPTTEDVSPRTPIVRDPSRFTSSAGSGSRSTICSSSSSTSSSTSISGRGRARGLTLPLAARYSQTSPRTMSSTATGNQWLDDASTTNSIISQDERQLDSLRENWNRISLVSSGQETFVTSSGSSLDDSPTRDRCAGGVLASPETTEADMGARLDALETGARNDSVQAVDLFSDDDSSSRSSYRATSRRDTALSGESMVSHVAAAATPNFSVPRVSSRRYSCVPRPRSAAAQTSPPTRTRDGRSSPTRASSRASSRASQAQPTAFRPVHRLSAAMDPLGTMSMAPERLHEDLERQRMRSVSRGRASQREKKRLPAVPRALPDSPMDEVGWSHGPRRHASTSAVTQGVSSGVSSTSPKARAALSRRPHIAQLLAFNHVADHVAEAEETRGHGVSFLNMSNGDHDNGQPRRPLRSDSAKRVSTGSVFSDGCCASYDVHGSMASRNNSLDSCVTITPDSSHDPYPDVERTPRYSGFQNHCYVPWTAVDGPPPAPPPTRALPPIPLKLRSKR
ncbi:hypothetical protein E4U42_004223 [Claviceps africana]|uniref:PH domain-containing protein n=1 Tax=Claviceps africana TaxID=83212 RepID=A0A8K0J5Z8_9HYPO|nr:hypothetical protein E4U42_004223 [Claviceps africana]